jgi:hypothetical protein
MAFAGALNKKEVTLNQCPELNNPENKNVDKLQAIFL